MDITNIPWQLIIPVIISNCKEIICREVPLALSIRFSGRKFGPLHSGSLNVFTFLYLTPLPWKV